MIDFPVFLFFRDQMIVTDGARLPRQNAVFLKEIEAFDASGRSLAVNDDNGSFVLSERHDKGSLPQELRKRIARFWELSGNPMPGAEGMELSALTAASVEWLKAREWKMYRRGTRLFWTLMLPCAVIPFAIGLFKIPWTGRAVYVYIACFAASLVFIAWLHRALYVQPKFPEPKGASK